jgi:phosphoglycolate phosphatase
VQSGFEWPDALHLSEAAFSRTDHLHGERNSRIPAPTEGLVELLTHLTSAGIICGVISNDQAAGIHTFLAHHGLARFFSAIWSADHCPGKPDPEAVVGLCRSLGVGPEECALVGDANSDLRMARTAGVAVVLGYPTGWSRKVTLDPEFLQVHHWSELEVVQVS